jgi:uncharacterized glyoxalase superfamily protein PhnB
MTEIKQRAIPILAYRDLPAIHNFLVDVFQMQAGGVEYHDGEAVHAEVRLADGSVIWLHRHAPDHGMAAPDGGAPVNGAVVVIVDDVEAHHSQARERGAAIDYPPTDQPYGLREYGVRDPEGGRWYIGSWL